MFIEHLFLRSSGLSVLFTCQFSCALRVFSLVSTGFTHFSLFCLPVLVRYACMHVQRYKSSWITKQQLCLYDHIYESTWNLCQYDQEGLYWQFLWFHSCHINRRDFTIPNLRKWVNINWSLNIIPSIIYNLSSSKSNNLFHFQTINRVMSSRPCGWKNYDNLCIIFSQCDDPTRLDLNCFSFINNHNIVNPACCVV